MIADISAITTTTASVCEVVMVELMKVIQGNAFGYLRDSSNLYDDVILCQVLSCLIHHVGQDYCGCEANWRSNDTCWVWNAFKWQTNLNVTSLYNNVSKLDGPQYSKLLYEQYVEEGAASGAHWGKDVCWASVERGKAQDCGLMLN